MKISIAMATFNGAEYLQDLLLSLSGQSLLPYELVVCDDGSTDRTLDLLRDYAESAPFPVRIYQNEVNLGFADNFLRAASLCNGDWIGFCDQDDVWLPSKLNFCHKYMTCNVSMMYHSAEVVDSNLNTLEDYQVHDTFAHVFQRNSFPAWKSVAGFTILFKASLPFFRDYTSRPHDPHRPTLKMAHDLWIPFIATIFGEIAYTPEKLVLYRQQGNNTMGASPFKVRTTGGLDKYTAQIDAVDYLLLSKLSTERALFITSLFVQFRNENIAELYQAYDRYTCHAHTLYLRYLIYSSSSFFLSFTVFVKLAFTLGYGATRLGGLGFKAFVKDSVYVFRRLIP